MTIDLTQIILAILTLIFAIITRYTIPYVKDRLDQNQMDMLYTAVRTAVFAAEQLYKSDQGAEKKEYVIKLLAEQGYIINPDEVENKINALIEATVKELKIELGQNK